MQEHDVPWQVRGCGVDREPLMPWWDHVTVTGTDLRIDSYYLLTKYKLTNYIGEKRTHCVNTGLALCEQCVNTLLAVLTPAVLTPDFLCQHPPLIPPKVF